MRQAKNSYNKRRTVCPAVDEPNYINQEKKTEINKRGSQTAERTKIETTIADPVDRLQISPFQ
jgi:hypothetical protein